MAAPMDPSDHLTFPKLANPALQDYSSVLYRIRHFAIGKIIVLRPDPFSDGPD